MSFLCGDLTVCKTIDVAVERSIEDNQIVREGEIDIARHSEGIWV